MSEIIASTYELIEKIGAGGGGNVYLANHLRLGKKVVLKADKRQITARPELLRREVDVLKDLSHSYIPQVYDFFVENETVYTVMDYIEGESLDRPLKRGERFSQPQVIKWAQQLLEALCYLHSPTHGTPPRGYVHSDIKPANLMRTSYGDICLIDFNIALALGEENVIGCSAGYASPEHYGLDFSTDSETNAANDDGTVLMGEDTRTALMQSEVSTTSKKKLVIPDIRSDIYSTGATLYHLLSGQRPSRHAKEVVPLSEKEFSPLIVKIISKAMNPNPDLRYQTAEEMLNDFNSLRENDPRVKRRKKTQIAVFSTLALFLAAGTFASFTGLKRMQTAESWLNAAEYSKNAFEDGDSAKALEYALTAFPENKSIFTPQPVSQAQNALTNALGVYNLSDGYKSDRTLQLPSAPLCMAISPDGRTAACIYAYSLVVFDTAEAEVISEFPVESSALSEVKFLDNSRLIYAGDQGITVYDAAKNAELWRGDKATAIALSGDGKTAATVYKNESVAVIYDTANGDVKHTVDFEGKHQSVTTNDRFANPNNNLLALNNDGTLLGVSFEDGSLWVYDLTDREGDIQLFDESSGYSHFEGGFYNKFFAFSASNSSDSAFAIIDTESMEQTGGFQSQYAFGVQTDENGIYVQTENILVNIHPVTGEQTPLVNTSENIRRFDVRDGGTLISTASGFMFFDGDARLVSRYESKYSTDFVRITEGAALVGSMDSPLVRVLKPENHAETNIFTYDSSYEHSEARVSADNSAVMLFSYNTFRVYAMDGRLLNETDISDPDQVYDQQYRRDEKGSRLEVTYYDGTMLAYSGTDGSLLYEEKGVAPDPELYEEFFTDNLRIESPLHGTPSAYDINTGELVAELEDDAYLTYVTQAGKYVITQYVTADGYSYGLLLNGKCEVLAELPYLTDIIGERLIFDYPSGNLRETHIYDIDELVEMARNLQ